MFQLGKGRGGGLLRDKKGNCDGAEEGLVPIYLCNHLQGVFMTRDIFKLDNQSSSFFGGIFYRNHLLCLNINV